MTEKIIEVDENDNQMGLRPADDFYGGKYVHRTSHLILFNSKNEILLQLRSLEKGSILIFLHTQSMVKLQMNRMKIASKERCKKKLGFQ